MQIFVLVLFLGLFVHKGYAPAERPTVEGWELVILFAVPKVLIAGTYALLCRLTLGMLGHKGQRGALRWLDYATSFYRWAVLALYGLDLWMGLMPAVRGITGDLILLDELLVVAAPLLMLIFSWWAYYPIDRRLRESTFIRRADLGDPLRPIWSRGQFLLSHIRHHLLLMLAPMMALLAWYEIVYRYAPRRSALTDADARPIIVMLGAFAVLISAPLIIRHLWDTAPLPAGELRDRLAAMCKQHRVRVRELLLWRTYGGMINGAVMGVLGPLRYILLTDALLETMPLKHVEAVMAHELAHVRRHHMFWLLVVALSALAMLQLGFAYAAVGAGELFAAGGALPLPWDVSALQNEEVVAQVTAVPAIACWFLVFGWVSRRFERQADTFAVQHLARQRTHDPQLQAILDADGKAAVGPPRIDDASSGTMIGALQQVADLNHIAPRRKSWRHGSIAWRQSYLRRIVGQPIDKLSIDRQVRWIKFGALCALLFVILTAVGSPGVEIRW